LEEKTVLRHFAMKWSTSARVDIYLLERQTRACSYMCVCVHICVCVSLYIPTIYIYVCCLYVSSPSICVCVCLAHTSHSHQPSIVTCSVATCSPRLSRLPFAPCIHTCCARRGHPPGRGRWHAPSPRHLRVLLSVCGGCSFGGVGCCFFRVCVCVCVSGVLFSVGVCVCVTC